MAPKKLQSSVWALAREQHGVVTRAQLIGLGYGSEAIRHRLRGGFTRCGEAFTRLAGRS
jgi:hypothetical protein